MNKQFFFLSLCSFFCMLGSLSSEEFTYTPPAQFSIDIKDIGLHHPVSTKQVAAQLYFDQGLSFHYAFNNEAAFWSFLKASENDPHLAMAYWGMALVLGADINTQISANQAQNALEYIQKAKELSDHSSVVEKDYIQALYQRYNSDNRLQSAQQYYDAMRELVKKYPDDPDAGVLYAASIMSMYPWNQWDANGNPQKGTLEAIAALDAVLRSTPDHIGANHYYIHALEDSKHPERALINAERLSHLLPASGHLDHMPSHIYLMVGDYHKATQANEEALAADAAYIKKYGMYGSYPVYYYTHNILYYIRATLMEGRFQEAQLGAQLLQKIYEPHSEIMKGMEYYASTEMFTLILMKNWKGLLQISSPPQKMAEATALWSYGRALAYTKLGLEEKALEEKRYFQKKVAAISEPDEILKMAELFLDAALAQSHKDASKAIQIYYEAMAIQNKQDNQGPVEWFFPARILLGNLFLKENRPTDAEAIFRQDLKIHPRYGSALLGLRDSLKAQHRDYEASWVDIEWSRAWKYSDFSFTNLGLY